LQKWRVQDEEKTYICDCISHLGFLLCEGVDEDEQDPSEEPTEQTEDNSQ